MSNRFAFPPSLPRILALLLGMSALPLAAATTSPVGYTEHRIAGTGGQLDRARTYLATPMLGREAETGVIARIDGTTVHLQSSTRSGKDDPASPSIRSTYAGTHYLQIAKGPRAGYHADLAGGDADSLQTTLAEFFGSRADDFSEDDIVILPSEYGGQDQYRLTRSPDGTQWQPHGEAPPADQAKIPSGSIVILHRQGQAFNLRLERPYEL